jgi:hypothetical protein
VSAFAVFAMLFGTAMVSQSEREYGPKALEKQRALETEAHRVAAPGAEVTITRSWHKPGGDQIGEVDASYAIDSMTTQALKAFDSTFLANGWQRCASMASDSAMGYKKDGWEAALSVPSTARATSYQIQFTWGRSDCL